jgi:hypothetical protein
VLAWLSLAPTRDLAVPGASRARHPSQHGEAQQGSHWGQLLGRTDSGLAAARPAGDHARAVTGMVAGMLRRQDGAIGTATAADMVRRLDTTMVPPSGEPARAAARPAGDHARAVTGMVAGMPTEPLRCGAV